MSKHSEIINNSSENSENRAGSKNLAKKIKNYKGLYIYKLRIMHLNKRKKNGKIIRFNR